MWGNFHGQVDVPVGLLGREGQRIGSKVRRHTRPPHTMPHPALYVSLVRIRKESLRVCRFSARVRTQSPLKGPEGG